MTSPNRTEMTRTDTTSENKSLPDMTPADTKDMTATSDAAGRGAADDALTIRQMCEAFDVTARALRFYEAKELLFPARTGAKRLYSRRDRARLKLILRGKRFGFSLEEIRQLLDLYDMGDQQETQLARTHELAQRHLAEMKAQRAELDEAIAELTTEMEWGAAELARLRGGSATTSAA